MKAWVLEAAKELALVDLPEPQVGDTDVLVRVRSVGLCGSDVEIYKGDRAPVQTEGPVRLGHEAAGIVEATGKYVNGFEPGDPVVVRGIWGCFAEYVTASTAMVTQCVAPAFHQVVKLPPAIPIDDASILEVLPKVLKAVARAGITPATDVLIKGQGVSGLLLTQAARLYSPNMLVVADLFDEKLELARRFGATHTINAAKENVGESLRSLMPNGADVVVTAHLEGDGVAEAIELLKWAGKIILYGCIGKAPQTDFYRLHNRGGDILAARMDNLEEDKVYCDKAIDYVASGVIDVARIITHRLPFAEVPQAFKLKEEPRGDVIHVVVSV